MYQAKVFHIMIGAPSDIKAEIKIAQEVVYEWNHNHSLKNKTVILPVHWSTHSYPSTGAKPQSMINKQVTSKSDMLVCIFGTRIGTPTDNFESGTIEEINEHLKDNKPVMVFFKTTIEDFNTIDIDQLNKVKAFKNSIQGNALYKEYKSSDDFKQEFNSAIQKAANDYFIEDNQVDINNGTVWESIPSSKITLSEIETERLEKWVNAKNPSFFAAYGTRGEAIYELGTGNQYEVGPGRERAAWDNFFEKLEQLHMVDKSYRDGKPTYKLKQAAYDYIDSLGKS